MIYAMCGDDPVPTGGQKVVYDYVESLARAGLSAAVWHAEPGFRYEDFADAPVVGRRELDLVPGDVLVVPESEGTHWAAADGIPRVVLNQNHFYMFQGVDTSRPLVASPDVVAAITVSRAIDEYLEALLPDLPTFHISPWVDVDLFSPAAEKEDLIAWMPRKRPTEMTMVTEVLRRSDVMEHWQFAPLDQMSPGEVAEVLGRAKVFLLSNEREGLGLPGIEAMSAGCRAVGFLGGGGREYADFPLCTPVEDGGVLDLVAAAEAAAMGASDSGMVQVIEETRRLILRSYGREAFDARVAEVFRELSAPGSRALVTRPASLRHFYAQQAGIE